MESVVSYHSTLIGQNILVNWNHSAKFVKTHPAKSLYSTVYISQLMGTAQSDSLVKVAKYL